MSATDRSAAARGGDATLWAADVGWELPAPAAVDPVPARAVDARRLPPVAGRRRPAANRTRYARRRLAALLVVSAVAAAGVAIARSHGRATPSPGSGGRSRISAPAPAPSRSHRHSTPPAAGAPIRSGDRGGRVAGLQAALGLLSVYTGSQDGAFGPATRAAVARFQSAHALPPDGVVGSATAAAIDRALVAVAVRDGAAARSAVAAAGASGRLSPAAATTAAVAVADAVAEVGRARIGPAAVVAAVLHDVAGQTGGLDTPRARSLFGMLAANVRRFRSGGMPGSLASLQAADGIVYRYFPGYGFQFHPLASFGALAAAVSSGRADDVRRIADAMLARAVPVGRSLVWEYYFPFGGPGRWTSGFAQAAGADALARAGRMLVDARIAHAARAAFAAIPAAYLHPIAGGSWIREYGFSSMLILNAQLQTYLLVSDYVRVSGDPTAAALAGALETAAHRLLPHFDTGCWSRYSLGGAAASPHYHAYHIRLLRQIAARTGDRSWSAVADRWEGYLHAGGCSST